MKKLIQKYPVLSFFVIVIFLGMLAAFVGITWMPIDSEHEMTAMHGILVFMIASPSVVGIVLTAVVDGRDGLKALFGRMKRWRVHIKWYVAALLVPFSIAGVSYIFQGWVGVPLLKVNLIEQFKFMLPFALMACVLEEFGWRGFALPRLQKRYNALVSSLIVGFGWALWHGAINYLGMVGNHSGPLLLPLLLIASQLNFADSVLLTWVHNNSGKSMLLVVLGHFSITMGNMFGPANPTSEEFMLSQIVSVAVHWLVVIVIIFITGPKRLVRNANEKQDASFGTNTI